MKPALAPWGPPALLCLIAAAAAARADAVPPESPAPMPAAAAEKRPSEPDPYERALALYRERRYAEAASVLQEAIRTGGEKRGYRALLGWALVHQGRPADAEASFRKALEEEPGSPEARRGLSAALVGQGRAAPALDLALMLLDESPADADAEAIANRALAAAGAVADRRLRAASGRGPLSAPARAGADYLEIRWDGEYLPLFVKGVNLGVALPGRFPAEFPEDVATYLGWLDQIAALGANAVRLYTLLPPVFYRALREHNEKVLEAADEEGVAGDAAPAGPPRGFLWLVQGVWTELPESDAYDDPAFSAAFREEIGRIVDVLHGNAAVVRRPGHAFGVYLHDVSAMTLALILGREWEPFSVEAYNAARPEASFRGRFFESSGGTAMEAWLASMMDHAAACEADRYAAARPVAFTNWPTLDPLRHPTEATKAEEGALARRLKLDFEPAAVREYDNDGVSLDASRIRATPSAPGGTFASYHAYPYYPDFMNLDPGYLTARDRLGPNNYAGYLADLRRHHAGLPVLISEVGVPTSRGVAHVQPQGFDHGGHDETAQGEIDARLVENIHDAGGAGAILFAWLDEWFKRNWLVMEFELPYERNPKWLNALDPEQNYGLLAALPGRDGPRVVLDGRAGDWSGLAPLVTSASGPPPAGTRLRALWAAHDEAYLYLRLDVDGLGSWDGARLLVGIDTYGEREGDSRFPHAADLRAPTGLEFVVDIAGPEASRLLVDVPYDLHTHRHARPYRSVPNDDGRFVSILAETNRRRIGRDGTLYPATLHDRSPLRFGVTDPNAAAFDSLADWFADLGAGVVEIRLPWGLLNVTDPSSRRVVDDPAAFSGEVGTRVTDGFRLYAAAVDAADGRVLDTLPARDAAGTIPASPSCLYAWQGWEEPSYHTRPKRSYFIVRDRWGALPDVVRR